MKERPILFSSPMVRAILAGTKTQTRRIVKPNAWTCGEGFDLSGTVARCPQGAPGDRLWVRETWTEGYPGTTDPVLYRATYNGGASHVWRPSIFMPRGACRIMLDVVSVRVERLQSITDADIAAEGVTREALNELLPPRKRDAFDGTFMTSRQMWEFGWDAINGKRASWESNPWVWAIGFARVTS